MKELVLKNVKKVYKMENKETFTALNDINVSFKKGELVSIVGESGSGKSTLMNLIGGLDSDFEGEILIKGENLHGLKEKELDKFRKNKVGFVFQSFNLIPHLTVLDNVTIALTLSGVSEKEKVERATNILTRLGLEKQIKKKPSQLSGGQKQRVAIARALINEPEIILADEPTGALDSQTTKQILVILKEIADEGKLVIMVTHSEKVASISSRVVEISDGKIIRDENNENYVKDKIKKTKKTNSNFKKDKQKLPFIQAIKLAFHNMWANKGKNLLMAFGVAISISALMLMLSFSSGLTDYISGLASSYSSDKVVTISKQNNGDGGSGTSGTPIGGASSLIKASPFSDDDIDQLIDDINSNVFSDNSYEVNRATDVSYGFMQITGLTSSANVTLNTKTESIFALYTTPTYYSDAQLVSGEMSGDNEIMFSPAILDKFNLDKEAILGTTVTVSVKYSETVTITKDLKITGIVDTSVFSGMLIMYVDYDYMDSIVKESTTDGSGIEPTSIYIKTDSKATTERINNYIKTREDLTGSVEERLASMFTEMLSMIGLALTIISCISLFVAAIMILVVLYISVTQRTREIGVLKSIGARRKDIKSIFTSESILVGILSGIVGILLSMILYLVFYVIFQSLLSFAPLSLKWWYFALAIGVSLIISLLSGLYPSAKAAKLDPVESLRRE